MLTPIGPQDVPENVEALSQFFELALPTFDEVKAALLLAALRKSDQHVVDAAKKIGINYKTAYNWRHEYFKDQSWHE